MFNISDLRGTERQLPTQFSQHRFVGGHGDEDAGSDRAQDDEENDFDDSAQHKDLATFFRRKMGYMSMVSANNPAMPLHFETMNSVQQYRQQHGMQLLAAPKKFSASAAHC
jgi:hypothetical protein